MNNSKRRIVNYILRCKYGTPFVILTIDYDLKHLMKLYWPYVGTVLFFGVKQIHRTVSVLIQQIRKPNEIAETVVPVAESLVEYAFIGIAAEKLFMVSRNLGSNMSISQGMHISEHCRYLRLSQQRKDQYMSCRQILKISHGQGALKVSAVEISTKIHLMQSLSCRILSAYPELDRVLPCFFPH